jgi:hypothetical protein
MLLRLYLLGLCEAAPHAYDLSSQLDYIPKTSTEPNLSTA